MKFDHPVTLNDHEGRKQAFADNLKASGGYAPCAEFWINDELQARLIHNGQWPHNHWVADVGVAYAFSDTDTVVMTLNAQLTSLDGHDTANALLVVQSSAAGDVTTAVLKYNLKMGDVYWLPAGRDQVSIVGTLVAMMEDFQAMKAASEEDPFPLDAMLEARRSDAEIWKP